MARPVSVDGRETARVVVLRRASSRRLDDRGVAQDEAIRRLAVLPAFRFRPSRAIGHRGEKTWEPFEFEKMEHHFGWLVVQKRGRFRNMSSICCIRGVFMI